MVIFEEDRRRKDWIEGRNILLENDQEWSFPLPVIAITLSLDGSEPISGPDTKDTSRRFSKSFFDRSEALLEFVRSKADDGLTLLDYAKAILPLAADLLRRNYDLSDAEIVKLLTFVPGNDRNAKMWDDIGRVAMCIGPKADPVG